MFRLKCVFLLGTVTSALAKMEGFIVGGKFANIDHHAHSAFLNVKCVYYDGTEDAYICGSSIINQNLLLTAAHCIYGCTSNSFISIKIGSELKTNGLSYTTDSYIIHKDYNPRTSDNDIGLLRVARRLTLGRKVARVAIMKKPPYNEAATVAGWGMIDEIRESFADRLKFISQKVWTRNRCLQLLQSLATGTICAASDNIGDYASRGDSGSALIVRGYIQIGLVSYKIPSISRQVVIYSDVGYYFDWINGYATRLSCPNRA